MLRFWGRDGADVTGRNRMAFLVGMGVAWWGWVMNREEVEWEEEGWESDGESDENEEWDEEMRPLLG